MVFTTLVAKQVVGEGKKLYHHEELPQKGVKLASGIRRRGWTCGGGDDDDDVNDNHGYDDDDDDDVPVYDFDDGWP